MITGNYNTRTESTSTNRNDDTIKVVSGENLFTECRVPCHYTVIVICLSLECTGLLCQQPGYSFSTTHLLHIDQICNATIGLYRSNFHLCRSRGHDNSTGFAEKLTGIRDGLSKVAR